MLRTLKGTVHGVLKDANGVVHEEIKTNNVVLAIRKPLIKLLGGYLSQDYSALPFISQMKFGSLGTPPTVYDTGLAQPITAAVKVLPVAPTVSEDGLQVTFSVVFGENELPNTTMREAALYASDNTMVARAAIGEYTKLPGMFFEFYWTIGFES